MPNTKTVKVIPKKPLLGIRRTPINSCIENIELTIEEIRSCIMQKALVDEYLIDGSLLRLDLSNYNTDNDADDFESDKEPDVDTVLTDAIKTDVDTDAVDAIKTDVVDDVIKTDVDNTKTDTDAVDATVIPADDAVVVANSNIGTKATTKKDYPAKKK